jgi:uncharacterized membrane protein YbhN (UPF0104 family)
VKPARPPLLGPRAKQLLRVGVTLAILALCVLAAWRLDWRGAAAALADASWGWLALAAAINFPFALLQSYRWQIFLRPAGGAPLLSLFRYLLASRAASNLLPARAGELLRIYLPHARDGLPVATLTSVLVVERFFDAAGLATVSAPLFFLLPDAPPWVRTGLLILLGGAALGIGAAVVLALRGSRKRESILDRIALSTEALRRPGTAVAIYLVTVGCWATEAAMSLITLAAARLPARPGIAILVLLAINIGQVLQVTPGNVGPFEAACLIALAAVGIKGPRALAMAVLYHLVQFLPVTVAGLEGLRFVGAARRSGGIDEHQQAGAGPARS